MSKKQSVEAMRKIDKAQTELRAQIKTFFENHKDYITADDERRVEASLDLLKNMFDMTANSILTQQSMGHFPDRYNKPKQFDGDIIITDPCYITKNRDETTRPKWSEFMDRESYQGMSKAELDECGFFEKHARMRAAQEAWDKEHPRDWIVCECGDNMEALGFRNYLSASTGYGDWSCTTFNSDTDSEIGQFCADAGMVGVFLLDEVLEYNPDYNYHIERPHTVTLIKDFHGTVEIIREGETVYIVGNGNINFTTKQTGL